LFVFRLTAVELVGSVDAVGDVVAALVPVDAVARQARELAVRAPAHLLLLLFNHLFNLLLLLCLGLLVCVRLLLFVAVRAPLRLLLGD
jgi:hypothetical protein